MSTLVQSNPTTVSAQTSVSRSLLSTAVGSLIVYIVSYIDVGSTGSVTPTVPTGFTAAINPACAFNGSTLANGASIFYQISAGGTVTATMNCPSGGASMYAEAVLCEFSGITASPLDQPASTLSNTAASTTGVTVGPTSALAQANELVISAVALSCSSGLANAGITTPSGYTALLFQQDTQSHCGAYHAYKEAGATTGQSSTWTWTADASMGTYQAVIATFKESSVTSEKRTVPQMTGGMSDLTGGMS